MARASPQLSLLRLFPCLAAEWHPDKNGRLTPDRVSPNSGLKVWWQCSKDPSHEWPAVVAKRTNRKQACPYCAGRLATPTTSLLALYPTIAEEWHPQKNGDLTLNDVTAGSGKKVWWQCSVNPLHVWPAAVHSRVAGKGCPMCAGRIATSETSLRMLCPNVAGEWHPEKNAELTPDNVTPGCGKKVWWRCSRDPSHEWSTTILSRYHGSGCPMCAGKAATPSTSLRAVRPELAAEWHPTKNGERTPDNVMPNSGLKAWWQCSVDVTHEWPATVDNRSKGSGCPMCSGRLATPTTSLKTLYPVLADEWHPTANGSLTPRSIRPGSKKRVWWQCSVDASHKWPATINSRVRGNNCPICSGRCIIPSTSLRAFYPVLADEWHPTKNSDLNPDSISPRSGKIIWWKCSRDPSHEWPASVVSRVGGGGCHVCAGRIASATTSLRALRPDLATEWHTDRNSDITPDDVTPGSRLKVWWRCSKDISHEWPAVVSNRSRLGSGCPVCAGMVATASTSLAIVSPELAAEWHPTKNVDLTPNCVLPNSGKRVWWQCQFDPTHVWDAIIGNRSKGRGCPFCRLAPSSWPEIVLAHEIRAFLDFDLNEHNVTVANKIWKVDIFLPDLRLVIEYDGYYYHQNRVEVDVRKNAELEQTGWQVIRAREEPLEPIGPNDVLASWRDLKGTADRVLQKIESVCGVKLLNLREYLKRKSLINVRQAESFRGTILREKAGIGNAQSAQP